VPLQEMRIGEMLDTAVKLYRQHWKTFMGLAAVVVVPYVFLQTFLLRSALRVNPFNFNPRTVQSSEPSSTVAAIGAAFTLAYVVFLQPLLVGAVARAAADIYRGEIPGLKATYRFALSRFRSILWISILTGLAAAGGFLMLVIPGIIFLVRFSFGTVVLVVEGERGRKALGRSWRLAKGRFWKIFGTLFLAILLTGVVANILQIPLLLASFPLGESGWPLRALSGAAASIVTRPFIAIITVLLYFDCRIRKEGMDIDVAARDLGLVP